MHSLGRIQSTFTLLHFAHLLRDYYKQLYTDEADNQRKWIYPSVQLLSHVQLFVTP